MIINCSSVGWMNQIFAFKSMKMENNNVGRSVAKNRLSYGLSAHKLITVYGDRIAVTTHFKNEVLMLLIDTL